MFLSGFFAGIFGTIFAYPLLALGELVLIILTCSLFSNRRYGWTISMMAVSLITALLVTTPPREIFPFITSHLIVMIEFVLGYIAVGTIYSVVRYFIFLVETNSDLTQYCRDRGVERSAIPVSVMRDFKSQHDIKDVPLQMSDYATQMSLWAIYWPISALTLVIEKPIKWFQRLAQQTMQAISNHLFGDVKVVEP